MGWISFFFSSSNWDFCDLAVWFLVQTYLEWPSQRFAAYFDDTNWVFCDVWFIFDVAGLWGSEIRRIIWPRTYAICVLVCECMGTRGCARVCVCVCPETCSTQQDRLGDIGRIRRRHAADRSLVTVQSLGADRWEGEEKCLASLWQMMMMMRLPETHIKTLQVGHLCLILDNMWKVHMAI